jgi:hypothetical protein
MVDLGVGRVIAGHTLVEKIGGGAYGEVWRAEYLNHPVALKLFTGARRPSNLRRELLAQYTLGRLDGPEARWFPRVDHIDLDAELPYVRMELVDGTTLEEVLSNPAISLDERLMLGERILEALTVVHAHNFVHGDLSPQNVLVTKDRSIRLIDVGFGALFGETGDIALSTSAEDASSGVASPLYSAPERFQEGGCVKASDLFSFGKLLYRMVAGEQPFVIKPLSLKFRALGAKWDDFLFKCLEERPEARFVDAAEALAEFRRLSRVELGPGEYRAECPECGSAQAIPGGRGGEWLECPRCGRKLEVLFYDDSSRYATTAITTPAAPDIEFVEEPATPETVPTKACPACGRRIRAEARKCRHCGIWVAVEPAAAAPFLPASSPSFVLPALAAAFGYLLFWFPGAILTWYFLEEARTVERLTGRAPRGVWALRLMMGLLVYLPFLAIAGFTTLGLLGALLFSLVA